MRTHREVIGPIHTAARKHVFARHERQIHAPFPHQNARFTGSPVKNDKRRSIARLEDRRALDDRLVHTVKLSHEPTHLTC